MKNKITELISTVKGSYTWSYCSLGGVTRVNIKSGEDIAHLGELPQTMWTVLSCPVKGLEMDERTLTLMDSDKDGKIRVDEVISAAQWLCRVLRDPNKLLRGHDFLYLSDFNTADEEGAQLKEFAEQVLRIMGLNKDVISLPELDEFFHDYDDVCKKQLDEVIGLLTYDNRPYGDNSDAAVDAVNAIRDKVADYFMRCKFIQFHDDCAGALDVSVDKVAAISDKNLATCLDEIAQYPLSRPIANCVLPLNEGINPAWQAAFSAVKSLAIDADYPGKESITEAEWNAIVAKLDAYVAAKAERVSGETATMTEKMAAEHDIIRPLEKALRYTRDFYTLLRNYVMMADFYDGGDPAIFQAGKLYIDSRCCNLCLRVTDMAAQADMARLSGMYLIYCTCTSKVLNQTMNIVAAMTDGDIDNLRVGKNAIFYDRKGQDWDAVVTKIIDNPISIRQAFWSPYKKFWNWTTEKLNKSASEKESKAFSSMTDKADKATSSLSQARPLSPEQKKTEETKKQAFDIAKFAGIFAAIGMAVGFITGALSNIAKILFASPASFVIFVTLIMLSISGPSMFIAWSKLRKRNLGPVLNANGWAINAKIVVNTRFGVTLTDRAQYPAMVFDDPYAVKKMPAWKRWTIIGSIALVTLFAILFFTNSLAKIGLPFHKEDSLIGEIVDVTKSTMKESLETVKADTVQITMKTDSASLAAPVQ